MKGIFHGDNLPTPPLGMRVFAGNFNCPLDGLRTAVAQKYPVQATYIRQEFAQGHLWRTHKNIGNMDQFRSLVLNHVSNFFVSSPQVSLSKLLADISGLDRVFLSNSGAESIEGAIKIARKFAHAQGRGGKIISMKNSFHGRTLATLATDQKKYQKGFEPIPAGFSQVPFNDLQAVERAVSEKVAAVILEPVQGEGGIIPADKDYLTSLRRLCDHHGILLIFDEIQSGIGRSGHWFAKDYYGVQPDIMALAKGLGGGVPVGAFLCNKKVSAVIEYGDHGTTFG